MSIGGAGWEMDGWAEQISHRCRATLDGVQLLGKDV